MKTAFAKSRPLLTARAKTIAAKASAVAGVSFDWTKILQILAQLLPLLSVCGLAAADVHNPGRLAERAVRRKCRSLATNDSDAAVLADAIFDNAADVTDDSLKAMKSEL